MAKISEGESATNAGYMRKNDAFFLEKGAAAYKRDLKNIDYNILNTGHFVLEEESEFAIGKMRNFFQNVLYNLSNKNTKN